MDFMTNEDRKQIPTKPKGRRVMPVIDPKKGFAVSADAAKALIAKGAADARPVQGSAAFGTSTNESVAVVAPSNSVVAGYQAALYPSAGTHVTSMPTVCRTSAQSVSITDVFELQRDDDTISAPNSTVSGQSSDTPDDPKDTSYGQNTRRKPAPPHTSTGPRKAAFTTAKKRKSTEMTASAKKRTRHGIDGTADNEQ